MSPQYCRYAHYSTPSYKIKVAPNCRRYHPAAALRLLGFTYTLYFTIIRQALAPADQYLGYFGFTSLSHLITSHASSRPPYRTRTFQRLDVHSKMPTTTSTSARPTLPSLHSLGLLPDALSVDNTSPSTSPADTASWVCISVNSV